MVSPDFTTLRDQITDAEMKGMFRTGWQMDYPSIENFLAPLYGTGASSNDGDYSNPEFDEADTRPLRRPTLDEANAMYQEAEAILAQGLPGHADVVLRQASSGWSDEVTDVKITPFGTIDLTLDQGEVTRDSDCQHDRSARSVTDRRADAMLSTSC